MRLRPAEIITNPTTQSPNPVSGDASIVKVGFVFHAVAEFCAAMEPAMASVKVRFVHGPVAMGGDLFRSLLYGAPGIRHVAIKVIHDLVTRFRWAAQKHGQGSREWFHVVWNIAKMRPD